MSRNAFFTRASVIAINSGCMNATLSKKYSKWTKNVPKLRVKASSIRHMETTGMYYDEPTREKVISRNTYEKEDYSDKKVTVVGTGDTGMAAIFALLTKGVTKNVCMIDTDEDKIIKEQTDLLLGSTFMGNPKIVASKDHADSADSKICVFAAGTDQERGENETEFIYRNIGIIEAVIPELMKYSPNAIYLIASEPVDILAYQAWRIGGMPKNRMMGTGTNMESARFRYLLSEKMGVSVKSTQGMVIGRGGRISGHCAVGSVLLWSTAVVAGVRLMDLNPRIGTDNDPENWKSMYDDINAYDEEIRDLKGHYSWATALSIADICEAILTNSKSVRPVSIYAKGEYSVRDDVFISLPCVLGLSGITDIVRQPLTHLEAAMLRESVKSVVKTLECLRVLK